MALVSGQRGLGKTLLMRIFLDRLPAGIRPLVIDRLTSMPTDVQLLRGLLTTVEVAATGRTILDLSTALTGHLATLPQQSLIVIDDAHLLTGSQLETLRTLLTERNEETGLALLLIGEEPIRERIERKRSLAESVRVHHVLNPLNASDSAGLLIHRLATTGQPGIDGLFTDQALSDLHQMSLGNPADFLNGAQAALGRAIAASSPSVGNQFVHSSSIRADGSISARETRRRSGLIDQHQIPLPLPGAEGKEEMQ